MNSKINTNNVIKQLQNLIKNKKLDEFYFCKMFAALIAKRNDEIIYDFNLTRLVSALSKMPDFQINAVVDDLARRIPYIENISMYKKLVEMKGQLLCGSVLHSGRKCVVLVENIRAIYEQNESENMSVGNKYTFLLRDVDAVYDEYGIGIKGIYPILDRMSTDFVKEVVRSNIQEFKIRMAFIESIYRIFGYRSVIYVSSYLSEKKVTSFCLGIKSRRLNLIQCELGEKVIFIKEEFRGVDFKLRQLIIMLTKIKENDFYVVKYYYTPAYLVYVRTEVDLYKVLGTNFFNIKLIRTVLNLQVNALICSSSFAGCLTLV